jgi:hypothetical protein
LCTGEVPAMISLAAFLASAYALSSHPTMPGCA